MMACAVEIGSGDRPTALPDKKTGRGDSQPAHTHQKSRVPKDPSAGQERNGSHHQPDLQKDLAEIIAIRPLPFGRDSLLEVARVFLDVVLFLLVTLGPLQVFIPNFRQ